VTRNESGRFFSARSGEEAPCPDVFRASGVRWVKVTKFIEESVKKIPALVDQLAQMKTPE
jgi:hypothetical protein